MRNVDIIELLCQVWTWKPKITNINDLKFEIRKDGYADSKKRVKNTYIMKN